MNIEIKNTTSNFIIRKATLNDVDKIAFINSESWQTTYRDIIEHTFLKTITPEQQLPRTKRIVENKELNCIVAEEINTHNIAGFACFGKNREPKVDADCELQAIYLLEKYQGIGIGKMLFNFGVTELKEKSKLRMTVSVFEANTKARTFYEKLGAKQLPNDCVVLNDKKYITSTYIWDLNENITNNHGF